MRWFAGVVGGGAAISGWDDDDMRSERGVAVKPLPPPWLLLPHPHTPARAAAPRLHPDARVGGGAHPQPPSEVGTDAGGGREKTLRYRVTHLEARLKKAEGQAAEKEELARKGLAESQRLVRGGWFCVVVSRIRWLLC